MVSIPSGVALYLLALVGFQLRVLGTLLRTRLVTISFLIVIVLLIALVPVVPHLPDIAGAAILTAICLALLVTELAMLRRSRDSLHASVRRERAVHEARETEWRREQYR